MRPLPSTNTPYHWSMGAPLSQFALFAQFGPSVARYRATSAALSGLRVCAASGSDASGGNELTPAAKPKSNATTADAIRMRMVRNVMRGM